MERPEGHDQRMTPDHHSSDHSPHSGLDHRADADALADQCLTVILPVYNAAELVRSCLESLFEPELDAAITELLIVDDASTDPDIPLRLHAFAQRDRRVTLIRNPTNLGYLLSVNQALARVRGAVILLNSDTRVGPGWASRLRAGAARYPRLGALTPLSNNATFSSIGGSQGEPISAEGFAAAERRIAARRGSDYPLAPTGMGFCLYLTPLARSVADGFDSRFAPGYEEENDLCMRLRGFGLQCRIATDVLVFHAGSGSFGDRQRQLKQDHYRLIQKIHPCYHATVREWFRLVDGPTLLTGPQSAGPCSVLLDGEILGQAMTGVVRYARTMIDLLRQGAGKEGLRLSVLVNTETIADHWRQQLPDVSWISYDDLRRSEVALTPAFDIYHVFNANISLERVLVARRHCQRFVYTLHDLIAYENPAYWDNGDHFIAYRQRLRLYAGLADRVLCVSTITASDAAEQLGIPGERLAVFANSLQHLRGEAPDAVLPPALGAEPFLLVVGTDYQHKNLPGTVALFRAATATHHPRLRLLLAGPAVDQGGTLEAVRRLCVEDPDLGRRVEILGAVDESILAALYRGAVACLYLSLQEGFGYIPYEAARHGCPTLVANTSVYGAAPAPVAVPPYICAASLAALTALIEQPQARQQNLAYWQDCLADDHQRDPRAELRQHYAQALVEPRAAVQSDLADLLHGLLLSSGGSAVYQTSFREASRQLMRRGLVALWRKRRRLSVGLVGR